MDRVRPPVLGESEDARIMPAQVIAASQRAATAREERPLPRQEDSTAVQGTRPWVLSAWVVFAATTAFFSAVVAIYWNASLAHFNDARYYVSMAEHPFRFTVSPWGFRILTPMLVWLIHVPAVYGFAVVNVLSLAATAAMLYLYLLEFYTPRVATFGLGLFAISPAVLIELKWVVDVDAFFFAMVMLAFLALARRQWTLLGVAMVLGVLDKETMLFVVLPLAVVGYIEYRFRPGKRWVGIVGLPILAYLVLHYTPIVFRPVPGSYDYLSLGNLRFVLHEQQQLAAGGAWYSFFWSMVDTFGALWILAILMLRRAHHQIRHTAVFLVPVLGSVLLADNWSRVLALGFVVVIPLVCAAGLERPFAAAVLMLSYDAMVSLGVKNLSGHATYPVEIPLLVAAIGAAFVMARARVAPRVAPRVLAAASDGRVQPAAGAAVVSTSLRAATAVSNGARQARATLRSSSGHVAAATSVEPRPAPSTSPPRRVLIPALSASPAPPSTTAEPVARPRPEPRNLPRVAAATNGSPAGAATAIPAAVVGATSSPMARAPRLPAASTPPTPAVPAQRDPVTSAPQARAETPLRRRVGTTPQPRVEVPAPPARTSPQRPERPRLPAPQVPAPRPPAHRPPAPRPPVTSQPGTARKEGGRLRPFRNAPVSASSAPSRKASATRAAVPGRASASPPRQRTATAIPPARPPARPVAPRPRSEAVVSLETAESLLADVQRLVEAASSRSKA